jgi:hypothetical protein
MAIEKHTGLSLNDVRNFIDTYRITPSEWAPAVSGAQSLQDANLSLIIDNTKKNPLTVYYLVDNTQDTGTALFSQNFNAKGVPVGNRTQHIKNIYATDQSDAKSRSFYELEKSLGLDLDADGLVGSSIVVQTSGTKNLASSDLRSLDGNPDYFLSMGLAASGAARTTLNITANSDLNKPIVIGTLSTEPLSDIARYADALMSAYQIGFPSITAGFGIGKQGIVNITGADIYATGGLISSFLIEALSLDSEYADIVIGGLLSGFGPRSRGVIKVVNSDLYFYRSIDPAAVTSVMDYDVMSAMLSTGIGGGNGTTSIENSYVEMKGTGNNISVAEDAGSAGRFDIINSRVVMDAQYSINDDPNSDDDLTSSYVSIGSGGGARGTMTLSSNSELSVDGLNVGLEIGREGGTGTFNLDASSVQQIARRTTAPLLRDTNPLLLEDYRNSWSGSYLTIGYDSDDGSARTNLRTSGTASFINGSLYVIRGPHAGLEVGGSGMRATGTLTINASTVEVVGSGAIPLDGVGGASDDDFLAAGINNSGSLNTGYFTFVNIGGSQWKDFGGTGVINVNNGSVLKVVGFDITTNDAKLAMSDARLSIGGWGTKGSLNINGGSSVVVAGHVSLGVGEDLGGTTFNKTNGLTGTTNDSMVNVQSGELEAFRYTSFVYTQGSSSPLTKYAMYTVLGSQGTITANQFDFYKNSQIIGSGILSVDDVFSNANVDIHEDVSTTQNYSFSDEDVTSGHANITETLVYVGDRFNFDRVQRSRDYGTLTIKSELDTGDSSFTIHDSRLFFDLRNGQSDKLIIQGFDSVNFGNIAFEINGNRAPKGQSFVLVDMDSALDTDLDMDEVMDQFTVKLTGIRGSLSYDTDTFDFLFTVQ